LPPKLTLQALCGCGEPASPLNTALTLLVARIASAFWYCCPSVRSTVNASNEVFPGRAQGSFLFDRIGPSTLGPRSLRA
jgi:hypothetical protein